MGTQGSAAPPPPTPIFTPSSPSHPHLGRGDKFVRVNMYRAAVLVTSEDHRLALAGDEFDCWLLCVHVLILICYKQLQGLTGAGGKPFILVPKVV